MGSRFYSIVQVMHAAGPKLRGGELYKYHNLAKWRRKKMLMRIVYKIKAETIKEYLDWSKGSIEYWRKRPGFKEMRAWREPGTGRVLLDIEFENFETWGKAYDDPKVKELNNQFASYTYDCTYDLWDASPVIPKPLKPL